MISGRTGPREILDSAPPSDAEAELSVVGSALLMPDALDEICLIVRPDDFREVRCRVLFEALADMHRDGKKIDATLLVRELQRRGELGDGHGCVAMTDIADAFGAVATAAHAAYYARLVADAAVYYRLRHVGESLLTLSTKTSGDADEALARAETEVFSIREHRLSGMEKIIDAQTLISNAMAEISARRTQSAGLSTGFVDVDKLFTLRAGQMVILAARTSMGKTALALNIALNVASEGNRVLIVSLEMNAMALADRLISAKARVNCHRLRDGFLADDERRAVVEAGAELSELPLVIDDSPTRRLSEIAAAARRVKRRGGLALIVVDYLGLVTPHNARDPRQEQVAAISKGLKTIARDLDVAMIAVAQLNRQVEQRADGEPRLSHLRESGAIEQDADVVAFVHRPGYFAATEAERREKRNEAKLIVAKQRCGPTGEVQLLWEPDFMLFRSASPESRGYSEPTVFGDCSDVVDWRGGQSQ